jgi:quinol-cytochrome oxidoreductase complex cytochrome b subunit/mono/diheme cytochrome c family protein
MLLFTLVLQAVTGILLAMNYAPAVTTAWPSVKFIQDEVRMGWLIRAMHHWGSSAMVILMLFHLLQVFIWGAYKRPRELTWVVGVLLLACTLGLAFTGYLLPWDQKAYWATKVGLGIGSTVPVIGDTVRTLVQGGPQIGNLTLTRFFALHVFILPGALAFLLVVHLYLFRLHGVTPPWWESEVRLRELEEPFWPGQVWKDAVMALGLLITLGVWSYSHHAPLEARADPSQPYEARPEWYFMFLFQLLRYFEGPLEIVGTFLLPAFFFSILLLWPFLDRSPHRDPRRRPVAMGLVSLSTLGLVGLTLYALATDVRMKEPMMAVARKPEPVAPAGPIQRLEVAKLFHENCVACHEVNGTGATIRKALPTVPDFTSLAWQMSHTDVEITHRIQDGQLPLMPAYRDKLSREQILALAIYVRAFSIEPTGPNLALRDRAQAVAPTPEVRPAEPEPERPKPDEKPASAAAIAEAKPAEPAPTVPAPAALKPEAADSNTVAARMEPVQIFRAYCLACHDTDGRGGLVRKAMTTIPDFTDAKWAASRTDADLQNSILNGKGVFMQPMRDKLGPSDTARMVSFIRELGKSNMSVALEPTRPTVAPEAPSPPAAAVAVVESPKPGPVPAPERPRSAVSTPAPPRPAPASLAALETSPSPETSERLRAATTLFREYCLSCHGIDGKGNVIRVAMPSIPDFTGAAWQASRSSAELEASVLEGKGTLMPAFRGKIGDDHARDLIAYVRSFGPSQPRRPRSAATTGSFEAQYRQLQHQWDELDKQLRALPPRQQPR